MHLVCLGVMKRLVQSYMSTRHGLLNCHLTSSMKSLLDDRVRFYKNVLPREFQRKIRSLNNYCHFKATEFRTVLLYTGPVLFADILPPSYYEHFLLLHFSMYVFISPRHADLYDHAKSCVERFLFDSGDLFNTSAYTYNAHCLRHLYDFVKMLGPLDNFSSFPYENYLYMLKKRIKCGSLVMTQCVNSIQAMRNIFIMSENRNLYFSDEFPNNCGVVIHNGKESYVYIDQVFEEKEGIFISGRIFKFVSDVYSTPYSSSTIGIGNFILTRNRVNRVQRMRPINKCILFPNNELYTVFPFAISENFQ